jgi:MYXO-CTERM domain-containing protein
MIRLTCRSVAPVGVVLGLVLGLVLGFALPAAAEPASAPPPGPLTIDGVPGRRVAADTPIDNYATPYAAQVSPTIFLNRCSNGCVVHFGNNDARTDTSSIPRVGNGLGPDFAVTEYQNAAGAIGTAADTEWNAVVTCMKEVYSPYSVTITDKRPASGVNYHEAIIAGDPSQVGLATDILGVAPLASDCSAIDNVISFSFANRHGMADRVYNICWTAAQESAHAYGLDHEFTFTTGNAANGHSACNDPMTYRNDCGGEKFFRNQIANCGETANRACKCGQTQNSHLKILSVFGAGAPITAAPTALLTSLNAGDMLGSAVSVMAGAQRGVSRVELLFNGFKWAEQTGVAFGSEGQPTGTYGILVPTTLPNSIVDVKAIAYDDLNVATESSVVTVTKGAPCTAADTCAKGQKCESGKCFWGAPAGEIGDSCSYEQFCKSMLCTGTKDQLICTQNCIPGTADSCPSGFDCLMNGANTGVCFFSSSGGCCSVERGGGAWWGALGLGALVLGYVTRRRRR